MQPEQDAMLVLGKFAGAFGVKGWVKVYAYTAEQESIFRYKPLYVKKNNVWQDAGLIKGQRQGKGLVAQLAGVTDRDQAQALSGLEIGVERSQLPGLDPDEYYWSDLQGMQVITISGVSLGVVDHLFETGANDVLVAVGERERCLPWLMGDVIKSVDLDERVIQVDWDPDF